MRRFGKQYLPLLVVLCAIAMVFFTQEASGGVTGKIYEGEVQLRQPGGAVVPFQWCIQFLSDNTLILNASGSVQNGLFEEFDDGGPLTFFFGILDNPFESIFVGINILDEISVLFLFQDNVGNTLEPGSGILLRTTVKCQN